MKTADAIRAVCKYAEEHEIGRATVTYRMRDWLTNRHFLDAGILEVERMRRGPGCHSRG